MPACSPAERSKFPLSFRYWYLQEEKKCAAECEDSAVGALKAVRRHTVEAVDVPGLWAGLWAGAGYWYTGELAAASDSTLSSGPGPSGT